MNGTVPTRPGSSAAPTHQSFNSNSVTQQNNVAATGPTVPAILKQLVESIVTNQNVQSDAPTQQQSVDELYALSLKLLSARFPTSLQANDDLSILTAMKRYITQTVHQGNVQHAASTTVRLDQLYQQLLARSTTSNTAHALSSQQLVLKNRSALLYLLQQLAGEGNTDSSQRHSQYAMQQLTVIPTTAPAVTHNNYMAADANNALAAPQSTRALVAKYTEYDVDEVELVRDLLYVLQGIDGQYIRYSDALDAYVVIPNIDVPIAVRTLCQHISECGWYYRRIRNYITTRVASDSESANRITASVGLVEQSFCRALNDELTEYYRLIAVLESQLVESMESNQKQQYALTAAGSHQQSTPNTVAAAFTLRRLYVWVQDPLHRLRLLATLADSVTHRRGGQLTSALHLHINHGDQFTVAYVKKITNHTATPLLQMIERWITAGELQDPHSEFFVQSNASISPNDTSQMWTRKYTLHQQMVPTFLPTSLAERILVIGKSINFIRAYDTTWQSKLRLSLQQYTQTLSNTTGASWVDNVQPLQLTIDSIATTVNQHLLRLILDQHDLKHHLLTIKRFILLSQGDYTQHLLDTIHKELDKSAVELYQHNLASMLESAIRSTAIVSSGSNGQQNTTVDNITNNITVRLLEATSGDSGWNVFSLQYTVDKSPLRVIFSPSCIVKYQRCFNMLFALKRVEFCLGQCFTLQITNAYAIQKMNIRPLNHLLRKGATLRHEMTHFVGHLVSYMMFEVVEQAYSKLMTAVQNAKDLDSIIRAHKLYLLQLEDQILMGADPNSHPNFSTELYALFQLIIQYTRLQRRIHTDVDAELSRRSALTRQIKESAKAGGWGIGIGDQSEDAPPTLVAAFQRYTDELTKIGDLFHAQFYAFLSHLHMVANPTGQSNIIKGHDTADYGRDTSDTNMNLNSGVDDFLQSPPAGPVPHSAQHAHNPDSKARRALMHPVMRQSQLAHAHELEFLGMRLDYNHHYAEQQKAIQRQQLSQLPAAALFNSAPAPLSRPHSASGSRSHILTDSNGQPASKQPIAAPQVQATHTRAPSITTTMSNLALKGQPSGTNSRNSSLSARTGGSLLDRLAGLKNLPSSTINKPNTATK